MIGLVELSYNMLAYQSHAKLFTEYEFGAYIGISNYFLSIWTGYK